MDERMGAIMIADPSGKSSEPPKSFTYDQVFYMECVSSLFSAVHAACSSQQETVYAKTCRGIVDSVLNGYNGMLHLTRLFTFLRRTCDKEL